MIRQVDFNAWPLTFNIRRKVVQSSIPNSDHLSIVTTISFSHFKYFFSINDRTPKQQLPVNNVHQFWVPRGVLYKGLTVFQLNYLIEVLIKVFPPYWNFKSIQSLNLTLKPIFMPGQTSLLDKGKNRQTIEI